MSRMPASLKLTLDQRLVWLKSLGRLPSAKKEAFVDRAEKFLDNMRRLEKSRFSDEDTAALITISERAKALITALVNADRLELPAGYVQHAWREITGTDYPDFQGALRHLAEASLRDLPEQSKRAAHRPLDDSLRPSAIVGLQQIYREVFEANPTFGSNSPFTRFLSYALPRYGFPAPSARKARRPFGD